MSPRNKINAPNFVKMQNTQFCFYEKDKIQNYKKDKYEKVKIHKK
jgi:hypothetical protein